MKSVSFFEANEKAKFLSDKKGLTKVTPFDCFSQDVLVLHEEGTTLFFRHAFYIKYYDWVLVFTEHHGYHVHHESDLNGIYIFNKVDPPIWSKELEGKIVNWKKE